MSNIRSDGRAKFGYALPFYSLLKATHESCAAVGIGTYNNLGSQKTRAGMFAPIHVFVYFCCFPPFLAIFRRLYEFDLYRTWWSKFWSPSTFYERWAERPERLGQGTAGCPMFWVPNQWCWRRCLCGYFAFRPQAINILKKTEQKSKKKFGHPRDTLGGSGQIWILRYFWGSKRPKSIF